VDVKLGELLETPYRHIRYNAIRKDKRESKKEYGLGNQQPSFCLETVEKVQRLRLA
jgi:hypothetical protein